MNNLVIMHDRQAVTTSLKVAEAFGKNHRDVLRAVDGLEIGSAKLRSQMFSEGTYENRGKQYRLIYMNRDGFTLLAMGFTGERAMSFKLQYIQAFNSMEVEVQTGFHIPQNLPEALRLAADQQDQINKMQPKVEYYDTQMHNPGLMTTTIIAKGYGKSAVWLNRKLKELGIIYRQGKAWVIKQKYAKDGLTGYENFADVDNQAVHPLLKWTQKGQKFIYDQLKAEGIVPVSEQMQLVEG